MALGLAVELGVANEELRQFAASLNPQLPWARPYTILTATILDQITTCHCLRLRMTCSANVQMDRESGHLARRNLKV